VEGLLVDRCVTAVAADQPLEAIVQLGEGEMDAAVIESSSKILRLRRLHGDLVVRVRVRRPAPSSL
jgi:hypothetical protein